MTGITKRLALTRDDWDDDLYPFVRSIWLKFVDGDPGAERKLLEVANVRTLQQLYQNVIDGDGPAIAGSFTPDVHYQWRGPDALPFTGELRGRDRVVEKMAGNFQELANQRPRIVSVCAQGNLIVVRLVEDGLIRKTRVPYNIEAVQFFTFRDDRVAAFHAVADSSPFESLIEECALERRMKSEWAEV